MHLIGWILNDDHYEVFVGRNHNLMLLRSDSQECEVVGWIEISNDASSLVGELTHETRILHG